MTETLKHTYVTCFYDLRSLHLHEYIASVSIAISICYQIVCRCSFTTYVYEIYVAFRFKSRLQITHFLLKFKGKLPSFVSLMNKHKMSILHRKFLQFESLLCTYKNKIVWSITQN